MKPIKKEGDHNSVKSADVISYLCKATHIKHIDKLSNKTFKIVTQYTDLIPKHKSVNKPFIVLDDYIGSGRYALSVSEELIKRGIPKSNIIICSLFISENGAKAIEEAGFLIEYVEKVENIINKLSPKDIKLLSEIEKSLSVDEKFSFGYNRSGNLVSLIRTPNNTLPVFWYKNSSRLANAPFERRKEK